MRNGRIYWVKQKLVGLLLMIIPLMFLDLFVANEAALLVPIFELMGLVYLLSRERIFRSDYIFDLRQFLR